MDTENIEAPPRVDPFVAEIAGVLLRWTLTSISAGLVSRHIVTAQESERLFTALAHELALWLPAGLALGWSMWRRWQNRRRRVDPQYDRRARQLSRDPAKLSVPSSLVK